MSAPDQAEAAKRFTDLQASIYAARNAGDEAEVQRLMLLMRGMQEQHRFRIL